jgi:hypothetical protein
MVKRYELAPLLHSYTRTLVPVARALTPTFARARARARALRARALALRVRVLTLRARALRVGARTLRVRALRVRALALRVQALARTANTKFSRLQPWSAARKSTRIGYLRRWVREVVARGTELPGDVLEMERDKITQRAGIMLDSSGA